jgi:dynein assembly factor with WDR repeat domains 1
MKLKRFLLRYYPPGIILEDSDLTLKEIDVLDLNESTDINHLAEIIVSNEPLISNRKKHHVVALLNKLLERKKLDCVVDDFYLFQTLHAHVLPLTNCAFNKNGSQFLTGSYDRTCKIWDTMTGKEVVSLEGHKNVVYAVAFNNPFGDKVITGSFDKTCKLWDAKTGENLHTFRGHDAEIVSLSFDPKGSRVVTGSMDYSARLYDVESGHCIDTFLGHTGEIVSVDFDSNGSSLLTGSFDHSAKLWDTRSGKIIHTFRGHRGEISCARFNHSVSWN